MRPAPAGYDLFRYLGGGGMGDVYLAREHAAERTVAMKFLRAASSPTSVERFLTEVRALARIDHPNIVRVITVDLDRADPHFTMEYAAGGTLSEQIKLEGPLEVRAAAEMAARLARAVQAAHDSQILHRDLKPSNIVIAADGTPKISDFGLAKRIDHDEELTQTSQAVGTPGFMPPEQISRQHGEFGPASDVYGLGATLYCMLTGKPPFDDPAPDAVLRKVRFEPPPRIRSVRAEVPIELEAIALKCLEKRSADRYSSAADLATDLDRFLAGEKPDAPPLTPLRRAKKWAVRNRRAIAAGAMFSMMIMMLVAAWRQPSSSVPVDYQEKYRKDLAAGRKVALVPAKGLPPSSRFAAGRAVMTQSTEEESEGAAALDSTRHNVLLELLSDPGIDSYAVNAELRFLDYRPVAERVKPLTMQEHPLTNRCGLYVGYATPEGVDGTSPRTFLSLNFFEYIPPEARTAIKNGVVDFGPNAIIEIPGSLPHDHTQSSPPIVKFDPVPNLPGPWRTVRLEVTKQGIAAFWGTKAIADKAPFANPSAEAIGARQAEMRTFLATQAKLPMGEIEWRPRQPIGIWCRGSSIAFRNVTVEPLPPSP